MKTLSILRHAKSSWDQPQLGDFYRPLNQRGQRNAPMMGQWMKHHKVCPDRILSSPAVRAWTTAHMIATEIFGHSELVVNEPRLYDASLDTLMGIISETDVSTRSLMLVGHNPGLTLLVNKLGSEFIESLPTCAVCHIRLPMKRWKEIETFKGETLRIDRPRDIVTLIKKI